MQAVWLVLLLQAWVSVCALLPTQEIKVHAMKSATSLLEFCRKWRNSSRGVIWFRCFSWALIFIPRVKHLRVVCTAASKGWVQQLDVGSKGSLSHFLTAMHWCRRFWKRGVFHLVTCLLSSESWSFNPKQVHNPFLAGFCVHRVKESAFPVCCGSLTGPRPKPWVHVSTCVLRVSSQYCTPGYRSPDWMCSPSLVNSFPTGAQTQTEQSCYPRRLEGTNKNNIITVCQPYGHAFPYVTSLKFS